MDKTLLNRIPRKLRANPGRYIALALMVAISAYCLVSICGSAETLIANSDVQMEQHATEDGEFSCLDPLSDEEFAHVESLGADVEAAFYMDFEKPDDSTLRVSAMRERINLVAIDEGGSEPTTNSEALIERNYANAKNITLGDTIEIADHTYTVVGLCTSPDYENPLQNLTDPSASFNEFGLVFVTKAAYDELHEATASTVSQSYLYSYRLHAGTSNDDVVEYISSLKFDALTAQNEFVRNLAYDKTAEKREIEDQVNQLTSGTQKLKDAIAELQNGLVLLEQGAQSASQATSYASTAAGSLTSGAAQLSSGAKTIDEIIDSFGGFDNMIKTLDALGDSLDASLADFTSTIKSLKSVVEALEDKRDDPSIDQAYQILLYTVDTMENNQKDIEASRTAVKALRETVQQAANGAGSVSDISDTLTSQMTTLASGLIALSSGLSQLDSGVSQLPDNMTSAVDGNQQILDGITELTERVSELEQRSEELTARVFDTRINKVSLITTQANNPRIGALAKNQRLFRLIGVTLSVLLLILISYVLSVFVSHTVEEEKSIIGALYALGVTRSQVLGNYVLLPVALALAGGIVGTIVGLSPIGISLQIDQVESGFSSIPAAPMPPAWVLICGIILPPVIAALVNIIVLFRKLNLPTLDLLNRREGKTRTFDLRRLNNFSFNRKFQVRRVIHERGIVITMFLGTFAATLLIMLGIDCYSVCNNLIDDAKNETTWEYLYTYVYPETTVPEGGTAVYIENLNITSEGDSHGVMLMGTTADNPYYSVSAAVGKNKCTISSAVAKKFKLAVGDKIVMTNSVTNIDYAFTVDAITEHESSLYVFMNIESMRELFNRDETYYNVVLSSQALDINAQALYSTTTYDDVQRAAAQFYDSIRPRMILLMVLPIVLFAVIMYLMLMVMIDRAALGISLLKIFGYEENLVRKLYLRANTVIIVVFALIEIPLSKLIIDSVYSNVMSSASVAGRFDTNPLAYVIAFVAIILIYTLVNKLLLRRVNKITPSDVLRNR